MSALLLRGGDQNLLPTVSRSLSVPDSGPLWDLHTSASPQSGERPASSPVCPRACAFLSVRCSPQSSRPGACGPVAAAFSSHRW